MQYYVTKIYMQQLFGYGYFWAIHLFRSLLFCRLRPFREWTWNLTLIRFIKRLSSCFKLVTASGNSAKLITLKIDSSILNTPEDVSNIKKNGKFLPHDVGLPRNLDVIIFLLLDLLLAKIKSHQVSEMKWWIHSVSFSDFNKYKPIKKVFYNFLWNFIIKWIFKLVEIFFTLMLE